MIIQMWKVSFALAALAAMPVIAQDEPAYVGRAPCPTNSSLIGYTNTTALNLDVIADMDFIINGGSPPDFFHYILCPDTTFKIARHIGQGEDLEGESPIIPGLSNTIISCGEDGDSKNNCLITGGDFHFFFPDFVIAKDTWLVGLTFEGVKGASIFGNAHPASHVVYGDCHWKNNLGSSTVYVRYTPSEEDDNEDGSRRLEEAVKPYDLDEMHEVMRKEAHALAAMTESRDLQQFVRYSMSSVFVDCTFKNNDDAMSTLFNFGGQIQLIGTTFEDNDVAQMGVFSVLGNGHAAISHDTTFSNNFARLGPVFIDSSSFLHLSRDNHGASNTGSKCDAIFLEDDLSTCADREAQCTGRCCAFGDESCDLFDGDSPSAAPTSKPRPVTAPTPPNTPVSTPSTPSVTTSSVISSNNKSGGCNGFCIAFSLVGAGLVVILAILITVYVRRRKHGKEMSGTVAEAPELAEPPELDKQID